MLAYITNINTNLDFFQNKKEKFTYKKSLFNDLKHYDLEESILQEKIFEEESEFNTKSKQTLTEKQVQTKEIRRKSFINMNKIDFNRKYSAYFEIISIILVIIVALLSVFEHEIYYNENLNLRVFGSILYNKLKVHINYMNYTNDIDSNNKTSLINKNKRDCLLIDDLFIDYNLSSLLINHENKLNAEIFSLFDYQKDFNISLSSNCIFNYEYLYTSFIISNSCLYIRYSMLILSIIASISIIISTYYHIIMKERLVSKDSEILSNNILFYRIIEVLVYMIVPYPGINSYFHLNQFNETIILPFSILISSFSIFKLFFVIRIYKYICKLNNVKAEVICNKHSCQLNSKFIFKILQKEHPFSTLCLILLLTCICFGYSLRNFELLFWETQQEKSQDWNNFWNSIWCIFVSMTTVGYGDFYPNTHFGRGIVIGSCFVGTYFVSMTMIFMTKNSILNELEFKAYKMTLRLKISNEIKDINSNMIYELLILRRNKNRTQTKLFFDTIKDNYDYYPISNYNSISLDEEDSHLNKLIYYKEQLNLKKRIKKFYNISTIKESLIDLNEAITIDMMEIYNEIEMLKVIENQLITFTDSQLEVVKMLIKNISSMKIINEEIDKSIFQTKNNRISFKIDNSHHDNNIYISEIDRSISVNDLKSSFNMLITSNISNDFKKKKENKSNKIAEIYRTIHKTPKKVKKEVDINLI